MIDLEFDTPDEAEKMLGALRERWQLVRGTIVDSPQARITEVAEKHRY
jgi:hypothetical protein